MRNAYNHKLITQLSMTAVLLLTAGFRVVGWRNVPPGLSQDEVLNADIVQGIINGRHALFFREGFGHEPLYHYFSFPFQIVLGDNLIAIRLPSLVISMLIVAAVMKWARHEFGDVVALIAGVGIAMTWWPIIFGRLGLRPIAAVFLITLTIMWWHRSLVAGILLGATMYTYTPAITLFGLPILMAMHKQITCHNNHKNERTTPQPLLIFFVGLVVYAPLFFYLRLHPDLFQRGKQLSDIQTAFLAGDIQPFFAAIWQTVGAFSITGDPRWSYAVVTRPILEPIASILFHMGLFIAVTRIYHSRYALLLSWWLTGIFPSMITPDAPSTIRMTAAIPPTFVLIGVTCQQLVDITRSKYRSIALSLCFFFLLSGIIHTVWYGFVIWPQAAATRLEKYQPIWQEIADDIRQSEPSIPIIIDSGYDPIDDDSLIRSLGYDPNARWINAGNALIVPANNAKLYIPEFAPIQPALLAAILLNPSQPSYRTNNIPSFSVYKLPAQQIPDRLDISFDGLITLHDIRFLPHTGDQSVAFITIWQANAPLPADLSIFIHAQHAPDASPSTQVDTLDAIPDQLQPNDLIYQYHLLPSPTNRQKSYFLSIGLYHQKSGKRLHHHLEDSYLISDKFYFDKAIDSREEQ